MSNYYAWRDVEARIKQQQATTRNGALEEGLE
jgi:hypothetical protein